MQGSIKISFSTISRTGERRGEKGIYNCRFSRELLDGTCEQPVVLEITSSFMLSKKVFFLAWRPLCWQGNSKPCLYQSRTSTSRVSHPEIVRKSSSET